MLGFLVAWSHGANAQVVPDGSTQTNVEPSVDKPVVRIAPAFDGTSLNRYENFNVPRAGVDLDNTTVGAATIVNEVTGPTPSFLEGPLSVLGATADVVIANPNGLTVSGGSFVNMRDLVLTTGEVEFSPGNGFILAVATGAISIGPDGLSGALRQLDLLSHQLRIEGRVDLPQDSLFTATLGETKATLNGADLAPVTSFAATGVALDITDSAFLSAGTIRLIANGDGPGMRISGDVMAAQDLDICADGFVDFLGTCDGAPIRLAAVNVSAGRHAEMRGGDVTLQDSTITAGAGNVLVNGTESVSILGSTLIGHRRNTQSFESQGGVTVLSRGDMILGANEEDHRTRLSTEDRIPLDEDDTDIAGDTLAILAAGDLSIADTDLISVADTRIESGGRLTGDRVSIQSLGATRFLVNQDIALESTVIDGDAGISLDAASINLTSGSDIRLKLESANSGVTLLSRTGDIMNLGGFVHGKQQTSGDEDSLGAVTILSARDFRNESLDAERLGVIFGDADDVVIRAALDIENLTARILSNFNVELDFGRSFLNETQMTAAGQISVRTYKSGPRRWYTMFTRRARVTEYMADFGEPVVEGEQALVQAAAGDLIVSGGSVQNVGGSFAGANITMMVDGLETTANRTGKVFFQESCVVFCSSFGSGFVTTIGGTVTASRNLSISAVNQISSQGGSLFAGLSLNLEGERIESTTLAIPTLLQRRGGFGNLFGGNVFWVTETPAATAFTAFQSDLMFRPRDRLRLAGAALFSSGLINIPADAEIVAVPERLREFGRTRGGAFAFTERLE